MDLLHGWGGKEMGPLRKETPDWMIDYLEVRRSQTESEQLASSFRVWKLMLGLVHAQTQQLASSFRVVKLMLGLLSPKRGTAEAETGNG